MPGSNEFRTLFQYTAVPLTVRLLQSVTAGIKQTTQVAFLSPFSLNMPGSTYVILQCSIYRIE